MFEKDLILDYDTIKALSVKTRLEIIKLLGKKDLTLSDIANALNISPATAKDHLDVLLKVGLIEKEQTKRKWKYYTLSPKAKKLFRKTETNVVFALFSSLALAMISLIKYVYEFFSKPINTIKTEEATRTLAIESHALNKSSDLSNTINQSYPHSLFLILAIVFFIIFVVLLYKLLKIKNTKR